MMQREIMRKVEREETEENKGEEERWALEERKKRGEELL